MKLLNPKKIVIWGTVASGKTTLAKQLSSDLQISTVFHTDELFYDPNKTSKDIKLLVSTIIDKLDHGSWIVDGNLDEKIQREDVARKADMVIIFHYPVGLLLKRMVIRDTKEILSLAKPPHLHSFRSFLSYKFQLLRWPFESARIIKNYNNQFVHQLYSMIETNNMSHKTFIVSSRKNLEKLLTLVS